MSPNRSLDLDSGAQLLESITDGLLAMDGDWRITYVSPGAQRFPLWPAQDIVGSIVWDVFPDLEDTFFETELRRAATQEGPYRFENYYEPWQSWFEIKVYPTADGLIMFFANIMERKLAEERIVRSEALLRAVADNSVDTIAIVSEEGRFLYLSSSARTILGIDPATSEHRTLFELLTPESAHTLRNRIMHHLIVPDEIGSWDLLLRDNQRHLAIKSRNLLSDPSIGGLLLNIRDVTELKSSEQELRDAKENAERYMAQKSTLVAHLSHEIRTPLTSILHLTGLLAKEADPDHQEHLRLLEQGARRLAATLNSVLLVAQLEEGMIPINRAPIALRPILEEIEHTFAPLARARGLRLEMDDIPDTLYLSADSTFLNRILTNVIDNAIKFTHEGHIRLRASVRGDRVTLCLNDTGVGISKEFLPQVFDEFRREVATLDVSELSSGLGLAITRRLVEALGGTITIASEKDVGTSVEVTLPRASPPLRKVATPLNGSNQVNLREIRPDLRILIVEDNPTVCNLLVEQLRALCEADAARSGEDALKLAQRATYDMVFVDIELPGMNGVETMGTLRAQQGYDACPIIAMTGYGRPEDTPDLLSSGFTDYLEKPFDFDSLIEVLLRAQPD